MRALDEIRRDFQNTQNNERLVELMNELERDYRTFKSIPCSEFLRKPEVVLYIEISNKRVF